MDYFRPPSSPAKAAIAGVVSSDSGQPLSWVAVMITGDSPTHRDIAAMTDMEGRYRYDGLEPGEYTLQVSASGQPPQEESVAAHKGKLARLDFVVRQA
jgi:hypothetical protein